MPENQIKDDLIASANAAAKIGGIVQMAYTIYDKFAGTAYSPYDVERLKILKQIYKDYLEAEAPVEWELDNKSCPTHRIQAQSFSRYCSELSRKYKTINIYYHPSKIIAKVVSAYLEARGERSAGGGISGDLLEQYLAEWLNFALNDLPKLGYDETSIVKIQKRIEYLQQVDSSESIFDYGSVSRAVTKFDVFDDIEEQLQICLNLALVEKSRLCARDLLDQCRNNISALLSDCADVIFYARGFSVAPFAFDLSRYIDVDRKRLRGVDEAYAKVRASHTGKILCDVISIASTTSFGAGKKEIKQIESPYYVTAKFQLGDIQNIKGENDFFPWFTAETVGKQILTIQKLGQSMLLMAEVKKLVEDAYDLTAVVGDLWAYVDKNGKRSLKALLFLMEKELDSLKLRFHTFYEDNRIARKEYNRINKVGPKKGVNPNFSQVESASKKIRDRLHLIQVNIKQIHQQMNDFPADSVEKVNKKKVSFYSSINRYFSRFCEDYSKEFVLSEMVTDITDEYETQAFSSSNAGAVMSVSSFVEEKQYELPAPRPIIKKVKPSKQVIEQQAINILELPLKYATKNEKYYYWNDIKFKPYVYQVLDEDTVDACEEPWQLGDDYENWMKGYFTRHRENYSQYQYLAKTAHDNLQNARSIVEVDAASLNFLEQINALKLQLELERPRWRFQLGLWPIRTKGWPFNQAASGFADLVLDELNYKQLVLESVVMNAKKRLLAEEELANALDPKIKLDQLGNNKIMSHAQVFKKVSAKGVKQALPLNAQAEKDVDYVPEKPVYDYLKVNLGLMQHDKVKAKAEDENQGLMSQVRRV